MWADGAVKRCLEAGIWKFAKRTVQLSSDPSVATPFGYPYAFSRPTDFVRTAALCADEFFNVPLTEYASEASYFFANIDPIYLSFVSNDSQYGGDFSLWPESFVEYVHTWLALQIAPKLCVGRVDAIAKALKGLKRDAMSKDAMEGPTAFPATGSWVRSRMGRGGLGPLGDRGRSGSLIG